MRTALFAIVALAAFAFGAHLSEAQAPSAPLARAVTSCGTLPNNYAAGTLVELTVSLTGQLCQSGGGGSGGSVTQGTTPWVTADSAVEAAAGTTADTAYAGTGNASIIAALKGIYNLISYPIASAGSSAILTLQVQGSANGIPLPVNLGQVGGVASITPVVGTGTSLVLKSSAGKLFNVYATNTGSLVGFLAVVNTAVPSPSGSISPLECVPLPVSGAASINYNPGPPEAFSTEISALLTTSCSTYTPSTMSGFLHGMVQ